MRLPWPRAAGLTLLALMIPPAGAAAGPPPAAETRGKPFWLALAKDCAVPAGESAFGLVSEAMSLLGSPDTEWRDDVGYGVVASCVYQKKLLKPEERHALVARLSENLRRGIGESGTDSVLLRSFSALDLSIFAALEDEDPALDDAGYRRLLDDALAYLRDERDLRGLEPRVGWIHATAHTADLLKFLARDRRFTLADQARLMDAAWAKMTALGSPVFTHAEDERLAAALAVRRAPPRLRPRDPGPVARALRGPREEGLGESPAGSGRPRCVAERPQPAAELLPAAVASATRADGRTGGCPREGPRARSSRSGADLQRAGGSAARSRCNRRMP